MLAPVASSVHRTHQDWFDATRPSRRLLKRMRGRKWPQHSPKFTVVTPVYNVKEDWLRGAVESVIAQTYPHWEMICINDHSTAPHIRPILDEMAARDQRVRVVHCATNRGVAPPPITGSPWRPATILRSWTMTIVSNHTPSIGLPRPCSKKSPT